MFHLVLAWLSLFCSQTPVAKIAAGSSGVFEQFSH